MSSKIDGYIDVSSFFSYLALVYLQKNRKALESHGVSVEFHPVFLGGINAGSGNKPPWTLKAKAVYSKFDTQRAKQHFGRPNIKTPDVFPIVSLLPQRSLVYIKETYPSKFETTFGEIFFAAWEQNTNVSKPEILADVLKRHFTEAEVRQILEAANSGPLKKKLTENTEKALGYGAFGAPWFQVTNKQGVQEPFFGSDRFHFMWTFLDLPWIDMSIDSKSKL